MFKVSVIMYVYDAVLVLIEGEELLEKLSLYSFVSDVDDSTVFDPDRLTS